MSGTSYLYNKSISGDIEDIKRLQIQRNKLEKISLDFKAKGYQLETLTKENKRLKASLAALQRESKDIDLNLVGQLTEIETERGLAENELEIVSSELEKYRVYVVELEQNNDNWRRESENQAKVLETVVDEAEEISRKLREAEEELRVRREEQNRARLEQQEYAKLKYTLDRQRHNYEIVENDYNTFKRQNEDLREYIAALEEDRIKNEVLLERMEEEKVYNEEEITREAETLAYELETNKAIGENQENFIDELRVEVDQLRKQNAYLKSKLDLLE